MPPVASTTARARTAPTPSDMPSPRTCSVTPAARPAASVSRSSTIACSTSVMPGSACTALTSARCTSAPVASPPACTIRRAEWPPSRVSSRCPLGSRSKAAPQPISCRSRSGPSCTSASTAAGSHSPTPARCVSRACASGVSAGSRTAAIPPWAQRVEPSSTSTFVTTATDSPAARACSATHSPATPEPTTQTSAASSHPGAGAASRDGSPVTRASSLALVVIVTEVLCSWATSHARSPGQPSRSPDRYAEVAALLVGRAGHRGAGVPAELDDPVGGVDVHDLGDVALGLGLVHDPVADQDDQVAGVHEVRGRAVDPDDAAAALAGDHVGLQPGAVGDVHDRDLLAGQQVGGVQQVLVDGHRADVVQVGLGHRRAVDLGLEHRSHHAGTPSVTGTLSIRRVLPARAATSSRAGPAAGTGPRSGAVSS